MGDSKKENVSDPRAKRWQRLLETDAPRQLQSIEISDSNIFADQIIVFSRVTAIIGRHGTGKSLLLRTIEALFGYSTPPYAPPFVGESMKYHNEKFSRPSGNFRVTVKCPDGLIVRDIELQASPKERAIEWAPIFGACYATPIAAFSDIGYMFDNSDPANAVRERDASRAELDAIRNITGRSYDKLTYRTVLTDEMDGIKYYSLFVIGVEDGRRVDSWTLSQGELWVHHILGDFLSRELANERLALIDEPETFLANSAQRPFVDQAAREILKKDSQLIVGTHSFDMLNRFPLHNIRLCLRIDGKIHVVQPATFATIRDAVGVDGPVRGLILVEDAFAAKVLKSLFAIYDVALYRDAEVVRCDGESGVRSGVQSLRYARRVKFVGVLDGDQRDASTLSKVMSENILYLPGASTPEQELLNGAIRHASFLSDLSGRSSSEIMAGVDACASLDHQYQIGRFARHMGLSEDTITSYLVRAWLQNAEIEMQARNLVVQLRSCITPA
ncbi:ATP-dependent nuclease [Nonomuraea rhizosphaerae]|uniref:ATP-dependent nuclease n=1 Tax=Nonomuraea rhizosphaerae TaxID=2665663 RepID=UPI001C5DEBE0|nr:ATP-binding protein [Nonomuraea rhizosphaerae]